MKKEEKIALLAAAGITGLDGLTVPVIDSVLEVVQERDTLLEINNALNAEVSKGVKSAKAEPLELEGVKYELTVASSTYQGQVVNHEVLAADAKLLKELVDINAGILRKIEE